MRRPQPAPHFQQYRTGAIWPPLIFVVVGMADLPPPFTPYLVILGENATGGRYFASAFSETEAEAAELAAGQMGLHVLRVVGDELLAHAADLPRGKIFSSGKGFVPLASRERVAALMALAEAAGTLSKPPKPADAAGGADEGKAEALPPAPTNTPASWDAITVGSAVLMREEGEQEGWYDAVVIEAASADPDAELSLRYIEFADYPTQTRRRGELALLPPHTTT